MRSARLEGGPTAQLAGRAVGLSGVGHCRSPQPEEEGEPRQPKHDQDDAVPEHGRDSGVCRVFDVTAGVDGVRVVWINQDGNRRTDSQTLELSRVFGVVPGPETTVETQRNSAANAVIDADSRRASHQVRRRWNPTCPKRRVDVRETVVAIPRKKGAVGDEEKAHENRQCGVEAKAPKRAPSVRVIHLSIETSRSGAKPAHGAFRRHYRTLAQTRPTTLVESRSSSLRAGRYRVRAVTETNPICAPVSPSSRSSTAASPSPLTL